MESCIILCGGTSRRMGTDKGSMLFNGIPMILHVLEIVGKTADEVIVILRDKKQINIYKDILKDFKKNLDFKGDLKFYPDIIKDQGPLVGIWTGLLEINSEYALVVPCDSPFISKSFAEEMFNLSAENNFDAIVPLWPDGHIEPLHSLYNKNIVSIIEKLIKEGKRDVKSIIKTLKVRYIDVELLDPTGRSFKNLNRVEDIF
jgi:molybdenum cofactor guanylyltransferase